MIYNKTSNKFLNTHKGIQPIRVLQEWIPSKFENTYSGFLNLVEQIIQQYNLDPGINYHIENDIVKTPYVDTIKRIHIQETFLSYVWCVSYTLMTIYNEALPYNVKSNDLIDDKKILATLNLFDYGLSLIKFYTPWDKENLPNPELYAQTEELSIEIANQVFIYALNYILCHEFAHVEMNHADKRRQEGYRNDYVLQTEIEADKRALELMQKGITDNTKEIISISIVVGLCCLLYFKHTTISNKGTHPDTDNRIHNVLEQMDPESSSPIWGIAYIAYRLWDYKFLKMYLWSNDTSSNKELYYNLYNQIQNEKKGA